MDKFESFRSNLLIYLYPIVHLDLSDLYNARVVQNCNASLSKEAMFPSVVIGVSCFYACLLIDKGHVKE